MKETVKIGYVGLGRRGMAMLRACFSQMPDVEIPIICDLYDDRLEEGCRVLKEAGKPAPVMTHDYDELVANQDIDAVVIMTGWHEHVEMAEKAMLAGKYTGVEVGCAFDLSECYRLIDVYEKTGSPLMMLENCCYGRDEMMALRLVREGLFGDVVHCDGGYHHNLPECELFLNMGKEPLHYRLASYISRNCEQYPTHELGPIAKLLGINRGNRMLTLSSFASKSGGLKQAARDILGEDSPYAKIDYRQGDIITTVITCAGGETIHLCLDTTLPRPYYSRNFTVRGTRGMYTEERHVVFLEGMQEPVENNLEEMHEKYDHPLHREYESHGTKGGHGGIDWLVSRAFVESVKNGTNTPIDAYDTVSWMAIGPLSEMSIARGGAPVDIPDFTRGKWINREPVVRSKYCLDEVCEDASVSIFPGEE
ncbi:MAG: Gfo/Idh/MocA family oxidoreductase [Clostridia bacterium]|nr:Gfo/Idh/MocA family oxidoreductase [Clostridia bacterium]